MTTALTRQALYARVWDTPGSKLSKELGLAGSTLAAICKRHGIPTPRAGYWMKREFGKPVEQPPLEDVDGMSAETEVILAAPMPLKPTATPKPPQALRDPSSESDPPAPASTSALKAERPPSSESDLHPLIVRTKAKLQSAPIAGQACAGGKGAFSVTVSPELVTRALQILDGLVRAIEAQGWSVERSEKGLQLCPDGEALSFTLVEQTNRVRHKITEEEREAQSRYEAKQAAAARRGQWFSGGRPPQIPDWDFRPTGNLVLQLDPNPMAFGAASGLRRTFSETRSRPLSDQIDKIIEALAARAAAAKEIRRIHADREAKRAEEEIRRKDAERRRRLEGKRQEFLEKQLERHTAAQRLENFLSRYNLLEPSKHPEAAAFIGWARAKLAKLEAELAPESLGQRYSNAELVNDSGDVPSWKNVE